MRSKDKTRKTIFFIAVAGIIIIAIAAAVRLGYGRKAVLLSENASESNEAIKDLKGCFIKRGDEYIDVTLDAGSYEGGQLFLTVDGTAKALGADVRPASEEEQKAAQKASEQEHMYFDPDVMSTVIENEGHALILIPSSRLCLFDGEKRMLTNPPISKDDGSLRVPFQTIAFLFGYDRCRSTIKDDLTVFEIGKENDD